MADDIAVMRVREICGRQCIPGLCMLATISSCQSVYFICDLITERERERERESVRDRQTDRQTERERERERERKGERERGGVSISNGKLSYALYGSLKRPVRVVLATSTLNVCKLYHGLCTFVYVSVPKHTHDICTISRAVSMTS